MEQSPLTVVKRGSRRSPEECGDSLELLKIIEQSHERLHSALSYLRPVDYYRGNPEGSESGEDGPARLRLKEINLELKEKSLPLAT